MCFLFSCHVVCTAYISWQYCKHFLSGLDGCNVRKWQQSPIERDMLKHFNDVDVDNLRESEQLYFVAGGRRFVIDTTSYLIV